MSYRLSPSRLEELLQRVDSIETLPGELGLVAPEVAVRCGLPIDRPQQIEIARLTGLLEESGSVRRDLETQVARVRKAESGQKERIEALQRQLAEVDQQPGRVAILMSHHGADTLINERGHNSDRHLAADMLAVVHRHSCVVAWLVGHRHFNRIEPRPGPNGGFWEITTSSIIDWPSQTRAIELVRHTDGSFEIASTMLDHNEAAGGLAALHHELAYGFRTPRAAEYMAGRDIDTNVRLVLPQR
jgi:hypothetical protein